MSTADGFLGTGIYMRKSLRRVGIETYDIEIALRSRL